MKQADTEVFRPMFVETLTGLGTILDKAADFFDKTGIDHALVLAHRLYPDQFPLDQHVRITLRHPLGLCQRFGVGDVPELSDGVLRLDGFGDLAVGVRDYLQCLPPSVFAAGLEATVEHRFRSGLSETFTGQTYLTRWVLPNFYFHMSTAFAILRGLGVPIGKTDYMGGKLPL